MNMSIAGSDIADSLWTLTTSAAPSCPALNGNAETDVAIVGGGYTGLSAALHLSEMGLSTTVLEAQEPGYGASGRNTGEVVPGWSKHQPDQIVAEFGDERGERMNAWVQASADQVFELIDRYNIECHAGRHGWLMPANTARRLSAVQMKYEGWARRGADVEMLDAAATQRLTGSEHYQGAWLHRGGGMIQPLGYARGLARAALGNGAAIHGSSPVTSLHRVGESHVLRTPDGTLHARRVIIATNAYSGNLYPALRRALVPLRLFQVATAPMGDNLAATILPEGHGISDARRVLWAFRKDPEGRLVSGVAPLSSGASREHMRQLARRQFDTVYPQLSDVPIEHFWNGLVAVTMDRLPRMVDLAPGVHAGFGYSGRGIAMATGMGRLLALRATDDPEGSAVFPVTSPRPLPLHTVLAPLGRLRAWWWRQQDRRDDSRS